MPDQPDPQTVRPPMSFFDRGVEVTVTIRNLTGADVLTYTNHVSHEFAVDAQLETPLVEKAAVDAVRWIAEKELGEARHDKRERERLEMMLGGPATPGRMAAHISTLLDRAGGGEVSERD